jgi:CDP-diglyceride synthetase
LFPFIVFQDRVMGYRKEPEMKGESVKPPRVEWRRRLLTAAVAVPVICLIVLSHDLVLLIGTLCAITVGYYEFSQVIKYTMTLNYCLLPLLCWIDQQSVIAFVTTIVNLFIPLWSMGPHEGVRTGLLNVFFTHVYAIPMTYAIRLRGMSHYGAQLTLMWICVSFASDAGALIIGNRFGRSLCCPAISPKKTWEGLAGAVVFGTSTSLIMATSGILGSLNVGFIDVSVLGILASVFGMMGDLIESGFKRFVDVKDASSLLPGHGGLLDRLDALAASVPVWYFYCQYRAF